MSQTNRVVRHKTNARKNYEKPLRSVIVYHENDGHAFTCAHQAESLRAALHQHAEELDVPKEDRIVVGNVMTVTGRNLPFVAIEL